MDLITDRVEADVLLGNSKGQYGFADLNRVEAAVEHLQEQVKALDINLGLITKTDWGIPGGFSSNTWPTESQMRRYLKNVALLCQSLGLQDYLPAAMAGLTWEGANALERALINVQARITATVGAFHYSGEVFAGEENIL